jgi:hypothetical protein
MSDYCTVANVAAQLRLSNADGTRKVLDETTDPKASEVEGAIRESMAFIDRHCLDAWRETASEIQIIELGGHYMGWSLSENGVGLRNIGLYELDKSKGDILVLRSGGQWIDMLDGSYEEGIGKDYWLDRDMGILYLGRAVHGQIRLRYRYGHPELSEVPGDIRHACVKLVACELLRNEFYAVMLGSGEGFATNRGKTADKWEEDAMQMLSQHRRSYIPGV